MRIFFLILLILQIDSPAFSQDAEQLLQKLRSKVEAVNDYRAEAELKTDVSFLNVPVSNLSILFKKPDEFSIEKSGGITIIPKGGLNTNLFLVMKPGTYVSVDAGNATLNGKTLRVVKLLPNDDKSDILLATVYVDEGKLLIRKIITTTRQNGTLEMLLDYGRYEKWALPDIVSIFFSTKDYKMPKGFTFDYEGGNAPAKNGKKDTGKGKVEIRYKSYEINKGG